MVGDAILDCYRTAGGRSRCFAGGAAVVAAHLRQLGASPVLVTRLSRDGNAARLKKCLDTLGVEVAAVAHPGSQPVRIRRVGPAGITATPRSEAVEAPPAATTERLIGIVAERRCELDAAIFADFGHGTVTPELLDGLLPMLRSNVRILAGDVSGPRPSLLAMRRFDLLTPTEDELRRLSPSVGPRPALGRLGARMVDELGLAHLLVTRNRAGCVRFDADGTSRATASPAATVVDEVGAGDALLAAATLGLAGGMSIDDAVDVGQRAAAAALAQLGNAPIDWPRLHAALATPASTPAAARPAA